MPDGSAATVLLRRLMRYSCERPKLRKIIEEVRDDLRKAVVLATVPRLHAPRPDADEVEALITALAMTERALQETEERMVG